MRKNIEAFPTFDSVVKIVVQKETSYFEINGKRASRKQFPLQNANRSQNARFDLTSRKSSLSTRTYLPKDRRMWH